MSQCRSVPASINTAPIIVASPQTARGSSGWASGEFFSWKEWSGFGRGCPGRFGGVQGMTGGDKVRIWHGLGSVILEGFSTLSDPAKDRTSPPPPPLHPCHTHAHAHPGSGSLFYIFPRKDLCPCCPRIKASGGPSDKHAVRRQKTPGSNTVRFTRSSIN